MRSNWHDLGTSNFMNPNDEQDKTYCSCPVNFVTRGAYRKLDETCSWIITAGCENGAQHHYLETRLIRPSVNKTKI